MPKEKDEKTAKPPSNDAPGAAVAKPARKQKPRRKPPQPLPPWKVLLHNDDKNDVLFVVTTIMELTPLNRAGCQAPHRWRPTTPASPAADHPQGAG
jgi:ATP-dependent Clp protease adapter protein ClpS